MLLGFLINKIDMRHTILTSFWSFVLKLLVTGRRYERYDDGKLMICQAKY